MASSIISLGIGSPASIPLFLTLGLDAQAAASSITPTPQWTLRALDRDETLFALQGYDGIETLRALDRDETLNPLEART